MIEFIILAILQGLFEWLPISSSGQTMIVAVNGFGISAEQAFSLAIWLHLGTTFAVLFKFRNDYIMIVKSFLPKRFEINKIDEKKRNWLIIATIGTAFTALPLYFLFRVLIEGFLPIQGDVITLFIAGFLIITGLVLLKTKKKFGSNTIEDASQDDIYKDSFISGLIQGVSILPGISRSGLTTSAILLEDYEQNSALKLSFLMSVPVALASIAVDILFGEGSVFGSLDIITILVATVVSFIVGYLTMELLLRMAKKIEFGYFCLVYGIIAFAIIIPFLLIPVNA